MKLDRIIIGGYLIAVGAAFLAGYLLFGIRELGLYFLLLEINLPASLLLVPGMDNVSLLPGWTLGAPAHIWATQIACMAVNGLLLTVIMNVIQKLRERMTGKDNRKCRGWKAHWLK